MLCTVCDWCTCWYISVVVYLPFGQIYCCWFPLGLVLGSAVTLHQSCKYSGPDLPSPTRMQCFLCCLSLPLPTACFQSQGDLQRRQLTFLLSAFSRTSVTLLLGFGMCFKVGSFCLRTGREELHPLQCVLASGCWPLWCRVLLLWACQTG